MDQFSWAEIIPIIVALVASVPTAYHYWKTRFKDRAEGVAIIQEGEKAEADATGLIVTAATALIEPYIRRVEELEALETARSKVDAEREAELRSIRFRLARVERNNYMLCDGVRRLTHQIRSLGAEPVFEIDEKLCEEIANGSGEQAKVDASHLT